jgi:hypothetical protein
MQRAKVWKGLGAVGALGLGLLASAGSPASLAGQGLADFAYENLAFRGLGFELGYIWPTRVVATPTYGVRMDLGYLGPGLRIVPGITYWSSRMKREEVRELEERLEELISQQGGPRIPVSLGRIDWSDLVLSVDAHVVWRVPGGVLTFAGVGAAAHILNGGGDVIADTFIEDLLDTVSAGANLHAGLEYPLSDRFRLYGLTRFEMVENFQYLELRVGGQLMIGGPAPGEVRR